MEGIIELKDWEKIDLRVGEIVDVEEIENADNLYKLRIDVGMEIGEKIVCAGIKKHYPIKILKNKKVVFLANLSSRKLKGIESQGMILAAVSKDKSKVVLISPEKDIDSGTKIS